MAQTPQTVLRTKRISLRGHLVASGQTTGHNVSVSSLEDSGLDFSRVVRVLLSINDGKVVVGHEPSRIALSSNGGTEDDHILGD